MTKNSGEKEKEKKHHQQTHARRILTTQVEMDNNVKSVLQKTERATQWQKQREEERKRERERHQQKLW